MALYIEYKKINGMSADFLWNVGNPPPPLMLNVVSIQADCDELEFIKNNFTQLPFANKKRVQVWHGDFAKFIYNNL